MGVGMATAGVAQEGLGYYAQTQAAGYQREIFDQTVALAEDSANLQLDGLRQRQLEERRATANTVEAIILEALKRKSTLGVSAVEAGVTGDVVDALDRDFTGAALNQVQGAEMNLEAIERQIERQEKAIRIRQEGMVLQAAGSLIPEPSLLQPLLGGALSIGDAQMSAPKGTFLGIG